MRELKFRAWDKVKRKMLYGVSPFNAHITDENEPLLSLEYSKHDDCEFMQYIGFKDKKGKEIYEGDIVRWSFKVDRNSELTYTADAVKWESYAEEEWPYSTISGFTLPESEDGYEVIGNIHENPELLEEEE